MSIEDYQFLIQSFIDGSLPIQEFETQYLAAFKAETASMNPVLFQVLDELFSDVDAYSPDCPAGKETAFIISEARLRQRASAALEKLEQILVSQV